MDTTTTLAEIRNQIKTFVEERDWDQYHTPKDLSIGIITEASELLEHFRFKSDADIQNILNDPIQYSKIESEIADVLFFVIRFAQKTNIDLAKAFAKKMEQNAQKYPVEKCKGRNLKYTEL